jgi:hypothetical protein
MRLRDVTPTTVSATAIAVTTTTALTRIVPSLRRAITVPSNGVIAASAYVPARSVPIAWLKAVPTSDSRTASAGVVPAPSVEPRFRSAVTGGRGATASPRRT